ncbi:F-box/LRR-repeat protein, partial [Thalictrum thalictroides]
ETQKMDSVLKTEKRKTTEQSKEAMEIEKKKQKQKIVINTRAWEDLGKDILLAIYEKLSVKDLIIGAPLCCTSWYKVSKDPSLWKDVDIISSFEYYGNGYQKVIPKQLVKFVVNRSQGFLNSIAFPFYDISMDDLLHVAERCPKLKFFEIFMPGKKVRKGKNTFHMVLSKLSELEGMVVTDCMINDEATLKLIDQSCPKFIKLKFSSELSVKLATLISTSLPKLKVLDLPGINVSREALLVILKDCKELEYLDVTECTIDLDGDVEIHQIARRLKDFKWKDKFVDPDSYEYWFDGDCGLTASSSEDSDVERKRRAARGGDPYDYDPMDYY